MAGTAAPYEIVKGLLLGITPPRPLFLPIVFSHAARIENIPLRAFLKNPTKISNSLRQLRGRLRSDGVTCYFDPLLEAEAIGGIIDWPGEGSPTFQWPEHMFSSDATGALVSRGEPASGGRVPLAVDVIGRLKATMRPECLLMASVTGPLTLAGRLAQLNIERDLDHPQIPESAFDFTAAVITGMAAAFVEAGANAVLIREDFLPAMSDDAFADWYVRLATTINIVRFYQALPVLVLTREEGVAANRDAILRAPWECPICPAFEEKTSATLLSELGPSRFGLALAPHMYAIGAAGVAEFDSWLKKIVSDARPAVITTASDLPAAVDIQRLNQLWEDIQRR